MTMAATTLPESDSYRHVTVMRGEVVHALVPEPSGSPEPGAVFVDATAGGGGHTRALLEACPSSKVIAFDRDENAVEASRAHLDEFGGRVEVVHARFSCIESWLADAGIEHIDGVVADLGLSTAQLENPTRGMSFRAEGPIDMRMDVTGGETARELIERLSQDELADVVYQNGEERRSRRVARCIKQALDAGELETTLELRRAVVRAVGPRRVGGIDPATRTFQALRIGVNQELSELEALLDFLPRVLGPGGVAAIISFHSLEDRLVKRSFLQRDLWKRLSKKPIIASEDEQVENPRSRSAKLRAARRLGPDDEKSPEPPAGEESSSPPFVEGSR